MVAYFEEADGHLYSKLTNMDVMMAMYAVQPLLTELDCLLKVLQLVAPQAEDMYIGDLREALQ